MTCLYCDAVAILVEERPRAAGGVLRRWFCEECEGEFETIKPTPAQPVLPL